MTGTCVCGTVVFEANAAPSEFTIRCNCRGCTKRGWWVVPVSDGELTVTQGEAVAAELHPGVTRHGCASCGLVLFYRIEPPEYGGPRLSVNVRALEGLDWDGLPVTWLDGLHDTWEVLGETVHRVPPFVRAAPA